MFVVVLFALALSVALSDHNGGRDWERHRNLNLLHGLGLLYNHECPTHTIISGIYTDKGNNRAERVFRYSCLPVTNTLECENSGFVNKLEESFHFKCPANKVLTGVKSLYNRHANDHRFSYRCCKVNRSMPSGCLKSQWYDLRETIRLRAPSGTAVTGIFSVYKSRADDRRWRFEICDTKE